MVTVLQINTMSSESLILANRFREVILSGTWIANTNYKNELTSISWETANRSVAGLNSIALLAQHINYYIKGINNVFRGGSLDIRDKFSFDFPEIASQESWEQFLETFWKNSEEFAEHVESLSDDDLRSVFIDERYGTFQRNIDGVIEHAYYHLGQLVLLKKLVMNPDSNVL